MVAWTEITRFGKLRGSFVEAWEENYQIWEASWKLRGSLGGNYQIWEASWKLRGSLAEKIPDLENFVEGLGENYPI